MISSFNETILLIGLGAPRTGTTWMADYFAKHPDVLMSPIRALRYFDTRYDPKNFHHLVQYFETRLAQLEREKEQAAGGGRPFHAENQRIDFQDRVRMSTDEGDYIEYFRKRWSGEPVLCEITPSYSVLGPEAFRAMSGIHSRVRFLFTMRNPIDRYWSGLQLLKTGSPNFNIYREFDTKLNARTPADVKGYVETIQNLQAAVAPDSIKYLFFEDIFRIKPEETIDDICDFIGASHIAAETATPINQSRSSPLDEGRRETIYTKFERVFRYVYEQQEGNIPSDWLDDMERFGTLPVRTRRREPALSASHEDSRASDAEASEPRALADDTAFSQANVMTPAEKRGHLQRMADVGMRGIPYPFGSAMAIVSDIDGSTRHRYDLYTGILVGDLGLDFGDSTWLQRQYVRRRTLTTYFNVGSGFFSQKFEVGAGEPSDAYTLSRTFNEILAEFHTGNIDHFHSYLPYGPRVVVAKTFIKENGAVKVCFEDFDIQGPRNCQNLFLFGICIVGRSRQPVDVREISVLQRDGQIFSDFRAVPFPESEAGGRQRLFLQLLEPWDDTPVARFPEIAAIRLDFRNPDHAANVDYVLLINTPGKLVLERLKFLRNIYNVEMSLISDHAAYHFRNLAAAAGRDRQQREYFKNWTGPIEALCGAMRDDDGNLMFSADADDPQSFCRILPDAREDLELRYVVPEGGTATSTSGWPAVDLVTPALTRAGDGVYVARRSLPNVQEPAQGKMFDGTQSLQSTFIPRLRRALAEATETPGLFWPLYTHLGGLDHHGVGKAEAGLRWPVPSPYFEPAALHEIQERTFNLGGTTPAGARLWFTRASLLYDFALMLRSAPDHVKRADANTVEIVSWHDPFLDKTLPRSSAQLYGLTFYVDDPASAVVRLDGRPLEYLTRNPPDETERPSVTIAECEIRAVVFDQLDPVANLPEEITLDGAWKFHPAANDRPAHGRLAVDGGGVASLRLPMHGWRGVGAQLLTFRVRRQNGAAFGIVAETTAGGRFLFGDRAMLEHGPENITAAYFFEQDAPCEEWRTLTAPFHDLKWEAGAAPGGPMPSHPLTSISVLCAGEEGAWVDIGAMAFLRPRATSLSSRRNPLYCLGGVVPDFVAGQRVEAVRADPASASLEGGGEAVAQSVDQRGYFCFSSLPAGIYRVSSMTGAGPVHDRRGALVELDGDVMSLVLERGAAAP